MKHQKILSLLLLTGAMNSVFGHGTTGTLGAVATATDVYTVKCFTETGGTATHHLFAQVTDTSPVAAPRVSVIAFRVNIAKKTFDTIDGDVNPSPAIKVAKGNGVYYLFVSKSATGLESYELAAHCESSTNAHTGTIGPTIIQNQ